MKYSNIFFILISLSFLISINSVNSTYANSFEFDELIVFGDSLSSEGSYHSKIAIPDPFNEEIYLYPSLVSIKLTGKDTIPYNKQFKGNNYALVGLLVNNNYLGPKLSDTIDEYFNENYIAYPNKLYIIWAGANDLAQDVINYIINPNRLNPKVYNYSNISTDLITKQASRLFNEGAKYIFIPNLPDFSLAPSIIDLSSSIIYSGFQSIQEISRNIINLIPISKASRNYVYGKIKNGINDIKKLIIFSLYISKDKNLRNQDNIQIYTGKSTGKNFIREKQYKSFKLIRFLGLKNLIDNSSILAKTFNLRLEESLQRINDKNIVFINIYKLFNDIIDNPKFYGIDDIVMPTCSMGIISYEWTDLCSGGSKYYHSEKTYLWSDSVHPSPFMHKVIAQYMISVFNAPVLVSSISRHLASLSFNSEDYITNTLFNLNPNDNIGKLNQLASITGSIAKIGNPYDYDSKTTNTTSLNVALTYGINPNLTVGSMLSASIGSMRPYDNFRYRYNSQIISLFSKYSINDNWWLNTIFDIGRIGVGNIRRTIKLGKGKHIEKGSTNGSSLGLNFTTGYDFKYKDNITLTPYISLNLHNHKVSGFTEKDKNSTSIRYTNSSTTYKDIKLSFRATKFFDALNTFIELGLTQPINNNPIKIKSGLKNTKISFVREINDDKYYNLNLALGAHKKFKNNLHINTNLNYQFNHYHNQQLRYSINLKYAL